MRNGKTLVALLLAGASTISIAHAQTNNAANLKLASASTQMAMPEIVSVTAADPQSGGDAGGGTATGNVGTIDVQGAGTTLGNGYIVPEDGPKERSTVTHQGIENMIPTSNPYQIISILPGVNQFQDDPLGLSGGTIRVRGLTASEMGFTVNGAPINDSGNFAVYPNELIDAENVQQIWVTQGSTDIDAPHVGASGGNIGVVTRAPLDYFNVRAEETVGEDSLLREFVALDTGWIGDFKGFASYSNTSADKWRGDGSDRRWHSDGNLLWQFLPHSSVGLTWAYNDGLNDSYRSYGGAYYYYPGDYEVGTANHTALQTFNEIGRNADYDTFWGSGSNYPINLYGPYSSHTPTCGTGPTSNTPICLVSNPNFPSTQTTNVTNYWKLNLNPFKNALITAPLHVQLTDDLRWETNGYVWYGDGGSGFGTTEQTGYSVVDGYLVGPAYGNSAAAQNEILLYEYEHTLTWRPGVTSKLVYDYDNFTFMGGLWYEHASQKQNEPFSVVNADGSPCNNAPGTVSGCNLLGSTSVGGPLVPLEGYSDKVDSVGQAAYVEATGRFLDDALKITVGLSLRNIHRSDHTYEPVCFDNPNQATYLTSGGHSSSCASVATTSAFTSSAAYYFFNGPTIGAAQAYADMRQYASNPHVSYTRMLPELNATYDLDPFQQIYAGVSTGYRTPSTNNLWSANSAGTVLETTDIKPEFNTTWEAGYRFHGDFITASTTAYLQDLTNYQGTVQIDQDDFITDNIGGVKIYGIDGEIGTKPWHGFTFYASGELQKSALDSDIVGGYCGQSGVSCAGGATGEVYLHTAGKQLVDTPEWLVSASIGYAQDGFFGAVTPHCYGQRATALINDEFVPANCTVDASVGYRFEQGWGILQNATLQLFALNLFDSSYLGQISTTGDTNALTVHNAYTASGAVASIAEGSSSTTNYAAKPGSPLFIGVRLNANLN